jgi:hypothetical protein
VPDLLGHALYTVRVETKISQGEYIVYQKIQNIRRIQEYKFLLVKNAPEKVIHIKDALKKLLLEDFLGENT